MHTAQTYLRWFFCGMGSVIGIFRALPPAHADVTPLEEIGGDFRTVGDDLRYVIRRNPPAVLADKTADGAAKQLELAGIS
jgi:hypothetical protein